MIYPPKEMLKIMFCCSYSMARRSNEFRMLHCNQKSIHTFMSFHIMLTYTDKVSRKFSVKLTKQIQLYLRARKLMEIFIWKISRIPNGFRNK